MEKEQISLRLPINLSEKLTQIAKKQGIARNALIVQELWEIPKKYKEKEVL